MGTFDFIAGNPPWVNWEALPSEYREKTAFLWKKYDLFEHKGLRARLGSAKDDISVLMTYVAIDKYLKENGKLCFVITQTILKTVGGGEGFRRFRLGKNGIPFSVFHVDDMVELQPFDSASNKTSVFICQKGQPTTYPVNYHIWRKKQTGSISIDLDLNEVIIKSKILHRKAQSINESLQGPWIVAKYRSFNSFKKVIGPSKYQARAGCCGWLNSVYLINPIERQNNITRVANYIEHAKKNIRPVNEIVESERIFPTLRGKEIVRWGVEIELGIIVAQDEKEPSKGISLQLMQKKFPKTLAYYSLFEKELCQRSGYNKYIPNEPFYAVYNFGKYSLAPFKVVWTRVGVDIKSAVVGEYNNELFLNSIVVPIETVVLVPFTNSNEAHYFCSVINSEICRFIISSYSNKGTGSFGSPHILENVKIPKFDSLNCTHTDLAKLSKLCHEKTTAGIPVADLEEQIDELAAELWGLTKEELSDINESLEEMR